MDSEVKLAILSKSRSRSAFNLGGPAPNRRRDGETNDTTLDLVLIPAPSQGFRGADNHASVLFQNGLHPLSMKSSTSSPGSSCFLENKR